jgi:uncharacterized protein
MKKYGVSAAIARKTARLIDAWLSLDVRNPAEAVARPAPPRVQAWFANPLAWLALAAIQVYQRLTDSRAPCCRFTPSCSNYMDEAIRKYGFWNGVRRGLHRVRRCTGFAPRGADPP